MNKLNIIINKFYSWFGYARLEAKKDKTPRKIQLDAAVLFMLVFSIIYFNFGRASYTGFLFFWLAGFILTFIYLGLSGKNSYINRILKLITLLFIITLIILPPLVNEIYLRHNIGPSAYTHDGALQVEEAIKFLLAGKNPYTEDYINTPLSQLWDGQVGLVYRQFISNPALYHLAYLPWYTLFSIPFYQLSTIAMGWYDQRFIYILLFLLSLLVVYRIPKKYSDKFLFVILIAFNPFFITHFVGGCNDIFLFFWIILSVYLLQRGKIGWSALMMGLAAASKQSAWLLLPFYFFYLWLKQINISWKERVKIILKQTWPFWAATAVILGFFLIWDANAFIDDIYRYAAGAIATSYPINGIGLSVALVEAGIIKSFSDYFPFVWLQLAVGAPIFIWLIKRQAQNNRLGQMMFNYGMFLLVFWFFSRFFHGNYAAYLSLIFISAYFLDRTENI